MIFLVKSNGRIEDTVCVYFGKSIDNKDELIKDTLPNGSIYYTIDTQEVYIYDKDTTAWIKQ